MCGDVEQNPRPPSDSSDEENGSNNEVLAAIKSLARTMESRHLEVISSLNEVKVSQKLLEERVANINTRLAAVELKVSSLESLPAPTDIQRLVAETVSSENAAIQPRLGDHEDRSRRDNVIFHGITDTPAETWSQTEEKVRAILAKTFSLQLNDEGIARAHRLGGFVVNKCRPVVVNFAAFKTRDKFLSQRSKLKGSGVTLQEDFCKSTRLSRKKLLEFGNACGQKFNLKYNKLHINKRCYVYVAPTDSVCEVTPLNMPGTTADIAFSSATGDDACTSAAVPPSSATVPPSSLS
ncbi:hypothetical protein HPB48_026078 [Haemaphysalis longicornis]|uniref:Uncharacterized protein n=1 Tax=Haemaphysalis longicornis TaxID=44386 RepID=A0A9J6HB60_HAELO|nr:hypothetical protein HPB48_026078 [Haemaphysalis longicornis]